MFLRHSVLTFSSQAVNFQPTLVSTLGPLRTNMAEPKRRRLQRTYLTPEVKAQMDDLSNHVQTVLHLNKPPTQSQVVNFCLQALQTKQNLQAHLQQALRCSEERIKHFLFVQTTLCQSSSVAPTPENEKMMTNVHSSTLNHDNELVATLQEQLLTQFHLVEIFTQQVVLLKEKERKQSKKREDYKEKLKEEKHKRLKQENKLEEERKKVEMLQRELKEEQERNGLLEVELEKERAARERAHRDVERLFESDDDVGKTIAATNERLKKQIVELKQKIRSMKEDLQALQHFGKDDPVSTRTDKMNALTKLVHALSQLQDSKETKSFLKNISVTQKVTPLTQLKDRKSQEKR